MLRPCMRNAEISNDRSITQMYNKSYLFNRLRIDVKLFLLYASIAVLPLILYFNLPLEYRVFYICICLFIMELIFIIMYRKAIRWQASEEAIKITSFLLFELSAIGTIFCINLIARFNQLNYEFSIAYFIIFSLIYLSVGSISGVLLHLRIKIVDPQVIKETEARKAHDRKMHEDFIELAKATNTSLMLVKESAELLPNIMKNFSKLTARIDSIENKYTLMLKRHETRSQKIVDMLINHCGASTDTLNTIKADTLNLIGKESERARTEADEIVSSMLQALNEITTTIEDSFEPFLKSIQNLATIDDKTSLSIDRMAEAADTFVKISEPQARLASEAAILIEESVANIRSIASRSLNTLDLELKTVIDEAVAKLKEGS